MQPKLLFFKRAKEYKILARLIKETEMERQKVNKS